MNLLRFRALLIFVIALVGIAQVGSEFLAKHLSASARAQAAIITGSESTFRTQPLEEDVRELHSKWKQVAPLANFYPHSNYSLGRSALLMSTAVGDPEEKIYYVCEALEYFRSGTIQTPHSPEFHIALADLQAQVPNPERVCEQFKSEETPLYTMSPAERLAHAVSLSPHSVVDTYLAAVVYLSIGKKDDALALLRENQEMNPLFSSGQRLYTFGLITTESDLALGIPRRYPEILNWIKYFSEERPSDFLSWRETFISALDDSIQELKQRHKDGDITDYYLASFLKNISRIPLAMSSEKIRKELDMQLAEVYRAEQLPYWADILQARSDMERIPVLKSIIADDKSPKTTELFGWTDDHEIRSAGLDAIGRSIGVFVPLSKQAELLVLQSESSGARLTDAEIQVMVSHDNRHFHTMRGVQWKHHLVDGREALAMELPPGDYRFLKVRYLGAQRESKFTNSMQQLLQVYGRSIS